MAINSEQKRFMEQAPGAPTFHFHLLKKESERERERKKEEEEVAMSS